MRNYAEVLAYWYLRLNGFFPIADFVLHHKGGDTDILAIRPPFACEYVKGERLKENDLLIKIIKNDESDLYRSYIGIIAEAKGGKGENPISRATINKKFDLESLKYNLRRLGLFTNSEVTTIAEKLEQKKGVASNFISIHKVLFAHAQRFTPRSDDNFSFISLEVAKDFIEERMSLDFKIEDWDKFNADIIQSIILQNF